MTELQKIKRIVTRKEVESFDFPINLLKQKNNVNRIKEVASQTKDNLI